VKTQTVEFDNGTVKARIVVSEATAMQGIKRSRLAFEAGNIDDPDLRLLRGFYYPALLAGARQIEINGALGDPVFDDFAALPELLVKQWEDAVWALNPHWLPQDTDEKKAEN
jgi:hypothetical protein